MSLVNCDLAATISLKGRISHLEIWRSSKRPTHPPSSSIPQSISINDPLASPSFPKIIIFYYNRILHSITYFFINLMYSYIFHFENLVICFIYFRFIYKFENLKCGRGLTNILKKSGILHERSETSQIVGAL